MPTVFSINITTLKNLDEEAAVEFTRRLLWAEGSRIGIGTHLMSVPDCIKVGDGGIDGFIDDAQFTLPSFIPGGNSGFQVKAGMLGPEEIKKELHVDKDLTKPLKPEVLRLIQDKNGTYVLILFAPLSRTQRTARENALREELTRCNFPQATFKIYDVDQIAGFAEPFFSLIAWINDNIQNCVPYEVWGERSDVYTPKNFVNDQLRTKVIEDIRNSLRTADDIAAAKQNVRFGRGRNGYWLGA